MNVETDSSRGRAVKVKETGRWLEGMWCDLLVGRRFMERVPLRRVTSQNSEVRTETLGLPRRAVSTRSGAEVKRWPWSRGDTAATVIVRTGKKEMRQEEVKAILGFRFLGQ